MRLHEGIKILIDSNSSSIQLDIFRNNGQVLMQIFKQKNVSTWNRGIELTDSDGLIINLHFHKNKTNNFDNFKRFFDSDIFTKFKKYPIPENSYFIGINSQYLINEIHDFILEILDTVYNLEGEAMEFTVNSY